MASHLPHPLTILTISDEKSRFRRSNRHTTVSFTQNNQFQSLSKPYSSTKTSPHLKFRLNPYCTAAKSPSSSSTTNVFLEKLENDDELPVIEDSPVKFLLWALLWASFSVAVFAFSPADAKAQAEAAVQSIKASNFGLKFANFLRGSGWPDEAVVFALATLPIIELRGAIPVGYWLQLKPVLLTALSVLGNMVPVPLIILYLKPLATFLAGTSKPAANFLDLLFKKAKLKAGPVEEFQWLGLMLFVAVPFPGTGAWTGAIIATILDIPFWSAMSANFCGVVLAGLLVNMLVNIGVKYAVVACIVMFTASGFMWSILRALKRHFGASKLI